MAITGINNSSCTSYYASNYKRPCMCVRIQTVITGILRGWDVIHTKKRSK